MKRFHYFAGLTCLLLGLITVAYALPGVLSRSSAGSSQAGEPTPRRTTRVLVPLAGSGRPKPDRSPTAPTATATGDIPIFGYKVVQTYPHDPEAFTQGLVYHDGRLFEGTGLHGRSSLREVELATGKVLRSRELAEQHFGEGIAIFGDRIYQLTWQSHLGFVYDLGTFVPEGEWQYPTEGWGLTHDGKRLIMSDGTATLHFLDPATLKETGSLEVRDDQGPVVRLNELEYVEGAIYANIWQTDRVARIDPATGRVTAWIDLQGLLPAADRTTPVDVLNGIAYDDATDRLFVTGKLWPKLFEIELVRK
jgi:glutaminyl-peptide cyclotransferase